MIKLKNANLFYRIKFLFITHMFAVSNAEGTDIMPITSTIIQIATEEGRLRQESSEAVDSSDSLDLKFNCSSEPPINYSVGKPLEVNLPIILIINFTTSSKLFQLSLICFDE